MPWEMAAAACSVMNSQMEPPCPVESTQFGRMPRYSASSTGGNAPARAPKPSTSSLAMPASARARVVPWKFSWKAVLSSTRPQSDVDAPTMATRRFAMLLLFLCEFPLASARSCLDTVLKPPCPAAPQCGGSAAAHLQAGMPRVEHLGVDLGRDGGRVPLGVPLGVVDAGPEAPRLVVGDVGPHGPEHLAGHVQRLVGGQPGHHRRRVLRVEAAELVVAVLVGLL